MNQDHRPHKISDWTLERWVLGELPPHEIQKLVAQCKTDLALAARYQALLDANAHWKASHSVPEEVHAIKGKWHQAELRAQRLKNQAQAQAQAQTQTFAAGSVSTQAKSFWQHPVALSGMAAALVLGFSVLWYHSPIGVNPAEMAQSPEQGLELAKGAHQPLSAWAWSSAAQNDGAQNPAIQLVDSGKTEVSRGTEFPQNNQGDSVDWVQRAVAQTEAKDSKKAGGEGSRTMALAMETHGNPQDPTRLQNPHEVAGVRAKGDFALEIWQQQADSNRRLNSGIKLAAGAVLQLRLRLSKPGFVAVYSVDGRGNWTAHLDQTLKVDQIRSVALPSAYELDQAPNFELFCAVQADHAFGMDSLMTVLKKSWKQEAKAQSLPLDKSFAQSCVVVLK